MLIRVDHDRRRLWICDRRCHHGLAGVVLITIAAHVPSRTGLALAVVGATLAYHDRRDVPWPLTRIETSKGEP